MDKHHSEDEVSNITARIILIMANFGNNKGTRMEIMKSTFTKYLIDSIDWESGELSIYRTSK